MFQPDILFVLFVCIIIQLVLKSSVLVRLDLDEVKCQCHEVCRDF
jgi:hypothetical protein